MIRAVLYDFGGVFTRSPFELVRAAGETHGMGGDTALRLCFGPYDQDTDHAWHRLERGELTLDDARALLTQGAADEGHDVDPFTLLIGLAGPEDTQKDLVVERALKLKADTGVKTAVVTNNIREFGTGWRGLVPMDELFDAVVDSCEVGIRKPDGRIFQLALDALGGIPADEAVLVDDALGNIAAARAFGLHAVHVGEDRVAAMDELEALVRDT